MQLEIEGYRLSPVQKRVWSFLQPENPRAGQVRCWVRIEGPVQVERLQSAFQRVIDRHEILRTTFPYLPGMTIPVQVISVKSGSLIETVDLSVLGAKETEANIAAVCKSTSLEAFDYEQGPCLRATLIEVSGVSRILFIVASPLCVDRAGLQVIIHDLARAYEAHVPADEPMQYADVSEWQNDLLESADAEAAGQHWNAIDFSEAASIRLPLERRPVTEGAFESQLVSLNFSREETSRLYCLANEAGVTPAALVQACWFTVLWRLTHAPEITVGICLDGRVHKELAECAGPLFRYVPLALHLEGGPRFNDLASRINESMSELSKWQSYFDWRKASAAKEDHVAQGFAFGFDFNEEWDIHSTSGLHFSITRLEDAGEPFKIRLACARSGEGLQAEFYFDSSRFVAEEIRQLARAFRSVLLDALEDPVAGIEDLQMLSLGEQRRLLDECYNHPPAEAAGNCMHELFEDQAAMAPDRLAIVFEDRRLSYRELNARANQLARYLIANGIVPDSLVAILMDRSIEAIVSILATFKAGAAFVPLDPEQPVRRLGFMIEDASAALLLTKEAVSAQLTVGSMKVIRLDQVWDQIAGLNAENLSARADEANLAYVIYTSGSTGRPKGVGVEHRQLVSYIKSIVDRLEIEPGASYATVTTLAADLGNTAIYPSLATGGCLHLLSPARARDAEAMADYFSDHAIDCLKIVPSHLSALLTSSRGHEIIPRKRLILGGEPSGWELINRIRECGGDCRIFNHYGPTETTVGVMACEVANGEESKGWIPLGRPLGNAQVYLLNERLAPVGMWEAGEILIGGACVSRGYLTSPDETAAKYLPNPFGLHPGERIYRTGDVARLLPDGQIEYIGRKDAQVKIRGYRIEAGEIEAAIRGHEAVEGAVVIPRVAEGGGKQLVAYIEVGDAPPVPVKLLKEYLRDRLPEYMVPSAIVTMKRLPITANGKLDHHALPAPDDVRSTDRPEFVAPKTEIEQTIAGVWQEVLRRDEVGIHDNFFELGGNSLLMVEVHSKLRDLLRKDMPLIDLFKYPSVNALVGAYGPRVDEAPSFQRSQKRAETRTESLRQQRIFRQDRRMIKAPDQPRIRND